jgi:uncharacterized protein YkwD
MKTTKIATILLVTALPSLTFATTSFDAFKKEVLNTHNRYRAQHHAPKLEWDDTLSQYAQRYASQCRFKHSYGPYGENLAAGYPSLQAAMHAWYIEKNLYSHRNPQFANSTGHFTQLVWKSTTKIGCGYVACNGLNGTPGNYLVCEYNPPGNVVNAGYFKNNVLPG